MGRISWLCAASAAALISSEAPGGPRDRLSNDAFERGQLIASGGGPGGASAACFACHGINGEGQAIVAVPALAGLSAQYQFKQLNDFASGTRPSDAMSPIAQKLSQSDRHAVSVFYARSSGRSPVDSIDGRHDPLLVQRGAVLFAIGSPVRAMQACGNCHGPSGQGLDPNYPALAGQPAPYIADQLHRWRNGTRRNDIGDVMKSVAMQMSKRDIAAVAAYLSALARMPRSDAAWRGPRSGNAND
jgi:cytochrome c553